MQYPVPRTTIAGHALIHPHRYKGSRALGRTRVFRRIIGLFRFVGFWKIIADGICRLATTHWSRLRDKESAVADVIRLSTMQTKEGFDSRLQLPHTKTAGTPGHSQTDLSLLARTTSCSSRMSHAAPRQGRRLQCGRWHSWALVAIWRNGCAETQARVRRARGKHFGLQKI